MGGASTRLEVYRPRPRRVRWKVPAFCNNDWIALSLLQMCEEQGLDRPFDVVYGAPQCVWQGGRPALIRQSLEKCELIERFEAYARFGVRCALTFSRLTIDPQIFEDAYANSILTVAEAYRGQVIIADDAFADYVRDRYPSLTLVASYDRTLKAPASEWLRPGSAREYCAEALGRYDEVVIRCEHALADDQLATVSPEMLGRTEVIVNQVCVPYCRRGLEHVHAIEQWNEGKVAGPCQECFHVGVTADVGRRLVENVLVDNRRIDELCERGVGTLKIGGRNAPIPKFLDLLGTYVFEPSGAFVPMRVALSRMLSQHRANCLPFAPFDLPR